MPQRARETWDRLGRNNQIIVVVASFGLLIALIGFISWADTPDYVPLFSNLSAQDANAITEKLSAANVPYRITQGGAEIEVPQQDHDQWQMKLLSENLPAQTTATTSAGDDVLSGAHMGDTEAIQNLRILRSTEDQVAQTISSIGEVASATVHYAPANNDPLEDFHHSASAAVLLTLKPGQQLSDENVRAIVRLVQMSYTGLNDKDISVVDSDGNLLWDGTHTGGLQGDEFHKEERAMELQKRVDLQSLLDRDFGPHTSSVLVHLELNQNVIKQHNVVATAGAPVTKYDDSEKLTGQGSANGAPTPPVGMGGNMSGAGPGGNIPSYSASTSGANGNYTHDQTGETLQPDISTTDTQVAPGQIKRYDVSVMLDSTKFPASQLATVETAIQQIIQANIGYAPGVTNQNRLVTVTAVPFNHTAQTQAAAAAAAAMSAENERKMLTLLAPFLIMAVGLFLLARALRRTQVVPGDQLALAGAGGPNGLLGPGAALALTNGANGNANGELLEGQDGAIGLTGEGGPHTFEVIEEAFDSNLESILHLAKSKPEMVAVLLKAWLSDEAA